MIIDAILERRDGRPYGREELEYIYDMARMGGFYDIVDAIDNGYNEDLQIALANYISDNNYNETIIDYVLSVDWIDEEDPSHLSVGYNSDYYLLENKDKEYLELLLDSEYFVLYDKLREELYAPDYQLGSAYPVDIEYFDDADLWAKESLAEAVLENFITNKIIVEVHDNKTNKESLKSVDKPEGVVLMILSGRKILDILGVSETDKIKNESNKVEPNGFNIIW